MKIIYGSFSIKLNYKYIYDKKYGRSRYFYYKCKVKIHSNFVSKVGDIIGVNDIYREVVRYDLILRYKKKIIFWSTPSYFFLNYKFMIAIFWKDPELNDLDFITDKLDVFLGSEYYYPTPR